MAKMTPRMMQENIPDKIRRLVRANVHESPILYYQDNLHRDKYDIKVIVLRFGHTGQTNIHDALSIWLGFIRDANTVTHDVPNMQFRMLCVETEEHCYYQQYDRPRTIAQSQIDRYFEDRFIRVAKIVTDPEFSIQLRGQNAFNEDLGVLTLARPSDDPVAYCMTLHEKELNVTK
jgi:hypothetical protein